MSTVLNVLILAGSFAVGLFGAPWIIVGFLKTGRLFSWFGRYIDWVLEKGDW